MEASQNDHARQGGSVEIALRWVAEAERKLAEGTTLSHKEQIAYFAGLLGASATRKEQRYGLGK